MFKLVLLRHGQSEFNLHMGALGRDPGIIDPKLTPLGHVQARHAADALITAPNMPVSSITASALVLTSFISSPNAK